MALAKSVRELEKTIAKEGSKLEGQGERHQGHRYISSAILLSVIGHVSDFPGCSGITQKCTILPKLTGNKLPDHSDYLVNLCAGQEKNRDVWFRLRLRANASAFSQVVTAYGLPSPSKNQESISQLEAVAMYSPA